ncbi:MAG: hypothetical protein Q9M89_07165 [Persephonella sp.]|nr:hypothetical protein [Persephonella sp.]
MERLEEENLPELTVSVGVGSFSPFDTSQEIIKRQMLPFTELNNQVKTGLLFMRF